MVALVDPCCFICGGAPAHFRFAFEQFLCDRCEVTATCYWAKIKRMAAAKKQNQPGGPT